MVISCDCPRHLLLHCSSQQQQPLLFPWVHLCFFFNCSFLRQRAAEPELGRPSTLAQPHHLTRHFLTGWWCCWEAIYFCQLCLWPDTLLNSPMESKFSPFLHQFNVQFQRLFHFIELCTCQVQVESEELRVGIMKGGSTPPAAVVRCVMCVSRLLRCAKGDSCSLLNMYGAFYLMGKYWAWNQVGSLVLPGQQQQEMIYWREPMVWWEGVQEGLCSWRPGWHGNEGNRCQWAEGSGCPGWRWGQELQVVTFWPKLLCLVPVIADHTVCPIHQWKQTDAMRHHMYLYLKYLFICTFNGTF